MSTPLPILGTPLHGLPRELTWVRDLEYFEGAILSEHHAVGGGIYLQKWCTQANGVTRSLFVRAEYRAVAEYLAGRITMQTLLYGQSDGIGFLVDSHDEEEDIYRVALDDLPPSYLPTETAMHDESLRPEWPTEPQSFVFDGDWNAKLLAEIERLYQNAYGFCYFASGAKQRRLPAGLMGYEYDGGYTTATAFSLIRKAIPLTDRARSVGVTANSPGILSLEAPTAIARQLVAAVTAAVAKPQRKLYQAVYAWSKTSPKRFKEILPGAQEELIRLCEAISVSPASVFPETTTDAPREFLATAKLVASYCRKLHALGTTSAGVSFLSLPPTDFDDDSFFDDDHNNDDISWEVEEELDRE